MPHDHHSNPPLNPQNLLKQGHNSGSDAVQWQVPHDPDHSHEPPEVVGEADLDLVEASFFESFEGASDPTSFLRLAGIPFEGTHGGKLLRLLRVERAQQTDIASLTPYLGGDNFRYDPLPKQMVSKRNRVAFTYFDGEKTVDLDFAEARALEPNGSD